MAEIVKRIQRIARRSPSLGVVLNHIEQEIQYYAEIVHGLRGIQDQLFEAVGLQYPEAGSREDLIDKSIMNPDRFKNPIQALIVGSKIAKIMSKIQDFTFTVQQAQRIIKLEEKLRAIEDHGGLPTDDDGTDINNKLVAILSDHQISASALVNYSTVIEDATPVPLGYYDLYSIGALFFKRNRYEMALDYFQHSMEDAHRRMTTNTFIPAEKKFEKYMVKVLHKTALSTYRLERYDEVWKFVELLLARDTHCVDLSFVSVAWKEELSKSLPGPQKAYKDALLKQIIESVMDYLVSLDEAITKQETEGEKENENQRKRRRSDESAGLAVAGTSSANTSRSTPTSSPRTTPRTTPRRSLRVSASRGTPPRRGPEEPQLLMEGGIAVVENIAYVPNMEVEMISKSPLIIRIYDIINQSVAERLIQELEPSLNKVNQVGQGRSHFRDTSTGWQTGLDDMHSRLLETHLEKVFEKVKFDGSEDMQLLKFDQFDNPEPRANKPSSSSGAGRVRPLVNRMANILINLREAKDGGLTVFPNLRLAIHPVPRSALIWFTYKNGDFTAERILHGGCPTLRATKWFGSRQ